MSKLRDRAFWAGIVGTALVRMSFFNQPTVLWVTPSCREEQQVEEDAAIRPGHSRCLENVPRSRANVVVTFLSGMWEKNALCSQGSGRNSCIGWCCFSSSGTIA